jgi:hypothetical protein
MKIQYDSQRTLRPGHVVRAGHRRCASQWAYQLSPPMPFDSGLIHSMLYGVANSFAFEMTRRVVEQAKGKAKK